MKEKLRAKKGYSKAVEDTDLIWLLESMEDIMIMFEEIKPNIICMDDQMERIVRMKQGENTTDEDFLKQALKEIKVYEKHGGTFLWGSSQEKLLAEELEKAKVEYAIEQETQMTQEMEKAVLKEARRSIKEEITVMAILKRTVKKRYGNLMNELTNAYLVGRNEFLTTIPDLLKLLNNYTPNWKPRSASMVSNITTGHSFFQLNMPAGGSSEIKYLAGTNRKFWSDTCCDVCGLHGHIRKYCPIITNRDGMRFDNSQIRNYSDHPPGNRNNRSCSGSGSGSGPGSNASGAAGGEVSVLRSGILLNQIEQTSYINPNRVLLDSESTDHIFVTKSW